MKVCYYLLFNVTGLCLLRRTEENVVCPRPPKPLGGSLLQQKKEFKINDKIQYACATNRHLFGGRYRTCLASGSWSGDMPYCSPFTTDILQKDPKFDALFDRNESSCISPNTVDTLDIFIVLNGAHRTTVVRVLTKESDIGVYFGSATHHGDIHYNPCKFSDRLNGRAIFHCAFQQRYPNPVVGIKIKEPIFYKICEVEIFLEQFSNCPRIETKKASITYDPDPFKFSNTSNNDLYNYGSSATYTCEEGFVLRGKRTRYCIEDNRWSGNNYCEEIKCEEPPLLVNGTWTTETDIRTFNYRTRLRSVCNSGYVLYPNIHDSNGTFITCTVNGSWSYNDVQCVEKKEFVRKSIQEKDLEVKVSIAVGVISIIIVIGSLIFICWYRNFCSSRKDPKNENQMRINSIYSPSSMSDEISSSLFYMALENNQVPFTNNCHLNYDYVHDVTKGNNTEATDGKSRNYSERSESVMIENEIYSSA